jgi:hypothetical protein
MVTTENFSKMIKWFGPIDGREMIVHIYELQNKSWFHGNLSSMQAEKLLESKVKGTFVVRLSIRFK